MPCRAAPQQQEGRSAPPSIAHFLGLVPRFASSWSVANESWSTSLNARDSTEYVHLEDIRDQVFEPAVLNSVSQTTRVETQYKHRLPARNTSFAIGPQVSVYFVSSCISSTFLGERNTETQEHSGSGTQEKLLNTTPQLIFT